MCPVNTIFRFVRNLAPEQKVSIVIPDILADKNEELKSQAFALRNGVPRHKTVIKFLGNTLALYSKKLNDRRWLLVTSPPQVPPQQDTAHKRSREESDNETDAVKKSKPTATDQENLVDKHQVDTFAQNEKPGIPIPTFKPVPCYSKPPTHQCKPTVVASGNQTLPALHPPAN